MAKKDSVFIEPSAAGPTQKMVKQKDGSTTVVPGKAHEARDGTVSNPGVKTLGSTGSGPQCPSCRRTGTLKMHMNKPAGRRIYCSHPECSYDTDIESPKVQKQKTQEISRGVKIMSQGPRV